MNIRKRIAGFDAKLSEIQGIVLTPEEKSALVPRMITHGDYDKYVFDGKLLDVFNEFMPDTIMSEVMKSVKDENCSKQFYHIAPMMDTLREFESDDVVPDGRYTKDFRAARALLVKMLPEAHFQVGRLEDTNVDIFTNKSGSAGAIAQGSKAENWDICLNVALRIKRALDEGQPFSSITIPALAYHRSQLGQLVVDGRYNNAFTKKDRYVHGLDGGTVTFEGWLFYPIYQLWKTSFSAYAGGKSPEELRYNIGEWRRGMYWMSTDFSKFDMHVPAWLIYEAFNIIKEFYFPRESWKYVDWVAYNFVNTQLCGPDGHIHFKRRGLPSGSYCTQIIGTVVNLLMNLTAMCHLTEARSAHEMVDIVLREMSPRDRYCRALLMMYGMGDDGLFFTRRRIDKTYVSKHAEFITKKFGVTVKPEKSAYGFSTDDPEFLKRVWKRSGEYQDPITLIINVIHNEHDRKYDVYTPWHILYGLFITYTATFNRYISESEILKRMSESELGLRALLEVSLHEMPGVFRGLGESPMDLLYARAERLYQAVSS